MVIFFAHTVLQKVQLRSQINMARKKVLSNDLTAGMLSKDFIAKDKAFSFVSCIKVTLAYWKKILHQVLAMVTQLGTPTFLLPSSCTDMQENELISIIFKFNRVGISDEEVDEMSYRERCDRSKKNPVLVAIVLAY